MAFQEGDTLGSFRLIRELGRGATGTVFLAEQTTLGRECALKVLAPELVRDQAFLERFRREGQIAASLRHKNIVRIFDLVADQNSFALAMDYVEGQELRDFLKAEQRLPQKVALEIISHVLDALDYAHSKGIVHRDVKPANIMIEHDGSVFLTDFSIARMAGTEKLTKTGMVIGTPEYMAPEQFDGKEVDARADVYATALILYELLSGTNPFCGDTLAEIIKKQVLVEPPPLQTLVDVPAALVEVVHKGLKKSPEERYQTAGEMREALMAVGAPVKEATGSLTQFLNSVELGAISMDDAVLAREKVKEAIDKGFKRMLTIVMLDLAGSSKIKIPNQTLVADRAFQDYRATINAILDEYGCERYDWSGDGAISLFADAVNGVDAAVKVQRAVSEVGSRHKELPDALKVRIGIRTGMVYYDPRRTLGQFASRTVDQAGHLEKDCPPGSIRLGDQTVRAIGMRYSVESKGTNRDDIEVFELDVHSPANRDKFHEPGPVTPPPTSPVEEISSTPPTPVVERSEAPTEAPRPAPLPPAPLQKEPEPQKAPETRNASDSKELFRPKSETGERPVAAGEEVDEKKPWWGWKTLSFLFVAWASVGLANKVLPVSLLPALESTLGVFVVHLGLVPLYCIYAMFRGEPERAKEAAVAGGVFFGLAVVLVAILAAS